MNPIRHAREILGRIREKSESVIVAFSGGKDSLCCLDLAAQIFPEVRCYFLFLVPGLRMFSGRLEYARKRWGVEIREYPHPALAALKRAGIYRPPSERDRKERAATWSSVEDAIRIDYGAPDAWLVRGWKQMDSAPRRVVLRTYDDEAVCEATHRVYPLSRWRDTDVAAYLRARRIPVPENFGMRSFDVQLTAPVLAEIARAFPDDYRRILAEFPQAEAAVKRFEFYGEEIVRNAKEKERVRLETSGAGR